MSGEGPHGSLGFMNKALHSLGLGLLCCVGILGMVWGGNLGDLEHPGPEGSKTFNHAVGTWGLCLESGP